MGLLAIFARHADLTAMAQSTSRIGWPSIAVAFAVLLGLAAVQALRWRIILSRLRTRLAYARTCVIVLIGFFFSQLLPTSIGGDIARVWKVTQSGTPLTTALNSVFLDRLTALLSAMLVIVMGASLLFRLFPTTVMRYVVFGALAGVAGTLAAVALARRFPSIVAQLARFRRARPLAMIGDLMRDAAAVLLDARTLAATLALSLVIQAAVSTVIWLIAVDAGADIELLTCLVLVPLVVLVSMLPISIAGWGVREGAMVVALGSAGVDSAVALATSITFGLIAAATGIPGGLLWLYEHKHA